MAAKKLQKLPKLQQPNPKRYNKQGSNEVRSPAGFRAIEDEKPVIDSSQLRDGDGLVKFKYNGRHRKTAMTGW